MQGGKRMEKHRRVDEHEIMQSVKALHEEAEKVHQIRFNLQAYLHAMDGDWESARKEKFLNDFLATQQMLSETASIIHELASQVAAIPGKMFYEDEPMARRRYV